MTGPLALGFLVCEMKQSYKAPSHHEAMTRKYYPRKHQFFFFFNLYMWHTLHRLLRPQLFVGVNDSTTRSHRGCEEMNIIEFCFTYISSFKL